MPMPGSDDILDERPEQPYAPVLAPRDDDVEDRRAMACNRLLLYMRGLGIRALSSLELAMESMNRAGLDADMATAMRELGGLLRKNGVTLAIKDNEGLPLRGAPPMNRRPMLASDVKRASLRKWLRKLFRQTASHASDNQ